MSPRLWIWGFCPVRSRQESRSAHGRSRVRRHGRSLTGESATTTYSRSRVCGEARAPFLLSASRGRSAAPAAAPAAEIRRVPKSLIVLLGFSTKIGLQGALGGTFEPSAQICWTTCIESRRPEDVAFSVVLSFSGQGGASVQSTSKLSPRHGSLEERRRDQGVGCRA